MNFSSRLRVSLLCATSAVALAPAARAQDAPTETVVVTGSRVIADAANSPTPLTIVSAAQLAATTPTDIPDALNKLPIFIGSSGPNAPRAAGSNANGNVLNLRGFGAQRTLILFDGHRVAPDNADGTVDVDTLPQLLMSRVDVVTGGASAVYGSDAVTGVVNFVLDKHFTGIKYNMNAGISTYADGASYQLSVAAGTDLFGGRGHIEGSIRSYHSDIIHLNLRSYGRSGFLLTGSGAASNPFVNSQDTRYGGFAWGGLIACSGTTANPCAANAQQFVGNGVIGPFNPGQPTGTANTPTGGDAPDTPNSTLRALLNTNDAFMRASYNIDDTTTFYIQGTAAQSYNYSTWTANYLQVAATAPHTFFKNNPFLPAAAQAQLAGGTTSTFTLTEYIRDQGRSGQTARGLDRNLGISTGLDGTLFGKYDWDVFYTHNETRLKEDDPHNQNNAKMTAALDGVLNSSGNPVCYVSTTAFASLYPGCVPMNVFGPTALTTGQYNYWVNDSYFVNNFSMDDAAASISGTVFELPAGPVKAALSGEYRILSFGVESNALPGNISCTGLRLCNTLTPLWQAATVAAAPTTSENVWEFAGEADIPILKDVPLIQSLSANLAGRYTDYSVSGAVETWKIGLDYHINDDVRFRATTSVDIRAPTLNDLYSPIQTNPVGFVDLHTGNLTFPVTPGQSQGNPNLVPEVARTYTAGVVLTPSFVPGFTASLDYYSIALKNAISNISGVTNSIQVLCEQSGGTSPYCALYVRPLPFSNTTAANAPILVLSELLNTALNQTEGWDLELNYNFQMSDIWNAAPGAMDLRLLANDQPYSLTVNYAGAPVTRQAVPKGRFTTFVDYTLGNWSFNLQDRWYSGYLRSAQPGVIFYQVPRGKALNYVDFNIDKKFMVEDAPVDLYFAVQNVINTPPPIVPNVQNGPNLYPAGDTMTADGVDVVGRYFTIGLRGNF